MQENKPSISIIVPIYNVEQFLKKCVDSLLNQTFKDFELILVDDESPDNCGKICDEYALLDKRIKVIHKKNGGISDARNTGIENAQGKYIGFVDSDDYIENDMYEVLYSLITKNNADIAVCNIMNCYNNNMVTQCDTEETLVVDNEEAFKLLLQGKKITGSPCDKLFKREIFNNVRFTLNKIYEDALFFADIMVFIKKVAIKTTPKYYYIHRSGSYTTTFNEHQLDIIEAYEKTLQVVNEHFPALKEQALFRLYWAHFVILDKMLLFDDYKEFKYYKEIITFLKNNAFNIIRNKNFNITRRVSTIFLLINVKIYRILSLRNNKKNQKLIENK